MVLSSSVYPRIKQSFSEPIKIKFLHEEIPADTYSRRCAFINDGGDANEGNQWSTEGCEVEESTDTCTICSCNHLTSFAILMQPVDLDLTDDQEGALWYITLVGSSISLLSLATTIFLLLFFGCWKTERSFLLMNLVLALMAAQVTFLAGINATSNQTTCRAVAILIHYFFLASFFWMMAHGIQLFFKVKSVFSATRDRRVEFFLFGWINPGAIVIVTSGVKPDGYEIEKYCWLSTDDGMVYAFIGPVLFIVVVNFFILFFVIKTFMSIKANCKKSDIQKTKAGIRACAVLMPLLGVTWLVGVIAVDQTTVPFQYIFAAVNSTQGLFIFIFHGLQNEDVKESVRRYRSRTKVSSLRTDSSHSGLNAKLIGKNNQTNLTNMPSPKTQHVGIK
ncbi:adhesion G-protein coupled receptor D1-like [Branchiostoma lanceolatum]|uniref:adhesion G-protein coupled receptor D1-like n=1 Tax=Branchiostoma lanceolatum TaxID=7740 RepID=UPI0034553CBD